LQLWGVPGDRLRLALLDVRDFLRTERSRGSGGAGGPDRDLRLAIAHETFLSYLAGDPHLSRVVADAHRRIVLHALNARPDWSCVDLDDEDDVYDLRYGLLHLARAELTKDEVERFNLSAYADVCRFAGREAWAQGKLPLARNLLANASNIFTAVEDESVRWIRLHTLLDEGETLEESGLREEALMRYEEAVQLLGEDATGDQLLVQAVALQARALAALGQLRDALAANDRAIEAYHQLAGRNAGVRGVELARLLGQRADILAAQVRTSEAIATYDKALAVEDDEAPQRLAEVRARLRANRAISLGRAGALGSTSELLPPSVGSGASGPAEAEALVVEAQALVDVGRLDDALGTFKRAAAIYRHLVEIDDRRELEVDWARLLMNCGTALGQAGLLPEALAWLEEARAVLERTADTAHDNLLPTQAVLQVNTATALQELDRFSEAAETCADGIRSLRALVALGREEYASDLALALNNLGTILLGLERTNEALSALEDATAIYAGLVEGGAELAPEHAVATGNLGRALRAVGREDEALHAYERALAVREQVVVLGQEDFLEDLRREVYNAATLQREQGRPHAALGTIDRGLLALGSSASVIDRCREIQLDFYRLRFTIQASIGRWQSAAESLREWLQGAEVAGSTPERPEWMPDEARRMQTELADLTLDQVHEFEAAVGASLHAVRQALARLAT